MTVDEYLERNPNSKYLTTARRVFDELKPIVWVSTIGKGKRDIPRPIRGTFFYKDMTTDEYDELMIINSKFNRIYVQEKRKREIKSASEQWSVQSAIAKRCFRFGKKDVFLNYSQMCWMLNLH